MKLKIIIVNNVLTHIYTDGNIKDLSEEESKLLFELLYSWNINMNNNVGDMKEEILYLGYKNEKVVIGYHDEIDFYVCEIEKTPITDLDKFENNELRPLRKVGQFQIMGTPYKLELLVSLFDFSLNDVEDIFILNDRHRKSKNLLMKFMNLKTKIVFKFDPFISNLHKTHLYRAIIYDSHKYNVVVLPNAIREYCREKGIPYTDITEIDINQLMGMNIKEEELPDVVYLKIRDHLNEQDSHQNLTEMMKDICYELKKEAQFRKWDTFLKKWGASLTQHAIVHKSIILYEVLNNPNVVNISYNNLAKNAITTMDRAFDECRKNGLLTMLNDERSGAFRNDFDVFTVWRYLKYRINISSAYVYGNVALINSFIAKIFELIFENDVLYTIFYRIIKQDDLLKNVPIDIKSHHKWARIYICFHKNKYEINGYTNAIFFRTIERSSRTNIPVNYKNKMEQRIHKKGENLSVNNAMYRDDIMLFGSQSGITMKYFTKNAYYYMHFKREEPKYRHVNGYPICFEANPYSIEKNIETWFEQHETIIVEEMEMDQDELNDYLYEIRSEFNLDESDRALCSEMMSKVPDVLKIGNNEHIKEGKRPPEFDELLKKKLVTEKCKIYNIEVPLYVLIGSYTICNFAEFKNAFVIISDCLPKDWRFFNENTLKIYNYPTKEGINGINYLITYNLPQQINLRIKGYFLYDKSMLYKYDNASNNPMISYYNNDDELVTLKFGENDEVFYGMNEAFAKKISRPEEIRPVESELDGVIEKIHEYSENYANKVTLRLGNVDYDYRFNQYESLNLIVKISSDLKKVDNNERLDRVSASLHILLDQRVEIKTCKLFLKNYHESIIKYVFNRMRLNVPMEQTFDFLFNNILDDNLGKLLKTNLNEEKEKRINRRTILMEENLNTYNPLEPEHPLYVELRTIFGNDVNMMLNRRLILTMFDKNELKNILVGIKTRVLQALDKDEIETKNLISLLNFFSKLINGAVTSNKKDSITKKFLSCIYGFIEQVNRSELMMKVITIEEAENLEDLIKYELPDTEDLLEDPNMYYESFT